MNVFKNEQKALLKQMLIEIMNKYNKQQITYDSQSNSVNVNGQRFNIPVNTDRSTISTRTTHTR